MGLNIITTFNYVYPRTMIIALSPRHRFLKLAEAICLGFTLAAILRAWFSPAQGFEESIYSSTPSIVWQSIIISNALALAVVIHQIVKRRLRESQHWIIGLSILFVNRLVVHYVPTIRGYFTYEGDHMTNIGRAIDIVLTGHVTPDNFYPVVHLFIGTSAIVSDLNIVMLGNISTPLMSCFFVVGLFLLARRMSSDPRLPPLVTAVSAPVMFNRYDIYLMPYGWAIFFTPFALYILLWPLRHLRDRVVAVLILGVFPLLHPLSCLYLAAVLAIAGSVFILKKRFSGAADFAKQGRNSLRYALLLIVIVLPWILSFQQFEPNLRLLYNALTTGTSPDVIDEMASTLDKIDLNSLGLIVILVKEMGDDLIFLIPSVAVCFHIIMHRRRHGDVKLTSFALMLLLTGSLYASYLFGLVPGLAFVASQRLLYFVAVFTPILFPIWMLTGRDGPRIRVVSRMTISVAFVVLASTISIFSLFPSPIVIYHNNQVTQMDVDGYDWIYHNGDGSVPLTSILSSPGRYADILYGTSTEDVTVTNAPPPDHFGYSGNDTSESWPQQTTYLVLLEVSRTTYTGVWSTVGRFTEADFERLVTDDSYSRIFSNGECEIWEASPC